jgi:hypothetical protein
MQRTYAIQSRVSEHEARLARELAAREQVSVSELLRLLVRQAAQRLAEQQGAQHA